MALAVVGEADVARVDSGDVAVVVVLALAGDNQVGLAVALVDVPASDEANRVALATITVGAR